MKKKVVVFGTGQFYQNRKDMLWDNADVIAFIDNNSAIQGRLLDGRMVYSPTEIKYIECDAVVLMSQKAGEMGAQLKTLGIPERKILHFKELFYGKRYLRVFQQVPIGGQNKKALVISDIMDYNGGTLAAIYAAQAMIMNGYEVTLAAGGANERFLEEMTKQGYSICICPSLPFIGSEELLWMSRFDFFIVNTFQMMRAAASLSAVGPVLWWIHEPSDMYVPALQSYENQDCAKKIGTLPILVEAVAELPRESFHTYFPEKAVKLLPYGIPDQKSITKNGADLSSKLVFAVVGSVIPKKAQEIFVQAVLMLEESYREQSIFWLIGQIGSDSYGQRVRRLCEKAPQLVICGNYTREQIADAYGQIDVVVCPSLEDSLPIVMTEGMMYGKACIASDRTGTKNYITDEITGLICKAGDPDSLADRMRWVIDHREKLPEIGRRAREIYEKNFSMKQFSYRLEQAEEEAFKLWEESRNQ